MKLVSYCCHHLEFYTNFTTASYSHFIFLTVASYSYVYMYVFVSTAPAYFLIHFYNQLLYLTTHITNEYHTFEFLHRSPEALVDEIHVLLQLDDFRHIFYILTSSYGLYFAYSKAV